MWNFDHSYARLPETFFQAIAPTPVEQPRLVIFNDALAAELGLDRQTWGDPAIAEMLSGNRLPEDTQPIAQAYCGHQFGGFTMLGDGRAILLGEQLTPAGSRVDIQLKGAGRTRYSRGGDGRAVLGPMLREYLVSEAMHALGVPTTRGLAVVATGESVFREGPLPGAILTRTAASHLRVGTFQFFAARDDQESLRKLADYVIDRHFPELAGADDRYFQLLDAVIDRQAKLIADWMAIGFVHGVMNTDNVSIAGETIDYGPCAFMDRYDRDTVFSSIDRQGRYAYGNQPSIAMWNLARFAETLLPLIDGDSDQAIGRATEAVEGFQSRYEQAGEAAMLRKLGLAARREGDPELIGSLLDWMEDTDADFTNTFRDLSDVLSGTALSSADISDDPRLAQWLKRLRHRQETEDLTPAAAAESMRSVNPAVIPRNHLVEAALSAAEDGDLQPFLDLHHVLAAPFADRSREDFYRQVPTLDAPPYRTFCGT